MTLLSARGISKAYGPSTLFTNVELTISEGDRIGLLGINGTGKSTLLRVLVGEEPKDSGVLDTRRGLEMLYLSQEPPLPEGATAYEAVLGGLGEWSVVKARYDAVCLAIENGDHSGLEEQAKLAEDIERLGGWERGYLADELLTKLGFADKNKLVDAMSGGERRRVALARILIAKPALAVLDEPTNHLDADTIEWLEEYLLENFEGAILFVTHDRYVLDTLATRIIELDRGTLQTYEGGYEDYLDKKDELLAQEARTESNRQNILRREKAWLLRGAKARTTKQKARIQRAESMVKAAPPRKADAIGIGELSHAERAGRTILEARELSIGYPGAPLVEGLNLSLVMGNRIGIVGKNGFGKTTFFKTVIGELAPIAGTLELGKNTKIAYFDQARADLKDDWSLYDNVAEFEGASKRGGGMVVMGTREMELRQYLELFLFDPSKQRQSVGSLSGGERARVALAKLLKTGANLLLLDEPTNDLDTLTLAALEDMLAAWPGVVLAVSHDRYFLNRVATSILAIDDTANTGGTRTAILYPGNYDDYRRIMDEQKALQLAQTQAKKASKAPPAMQTPSKPPPPPEPKRSKLSYKDKVEFDGILDRIAGAEVRVAALTAELATSAVYNDAKLAAETQTKLNSAQYDVAKLVARWEELETLST
jgi:ABC transport system ATP-binding/permease protein